jgi:hypothetical protein
MKLSGATREVYNNLLTSMLKDKSGYCIKWTKKTAEKWLQENGYGEGTLYTVKQLVEDGFFDEKVMRKHKILTCKEAQDIYESNRGGEPIPEQHSLTVYDASIDDPDNFRKDDFVDKVIQAFEECYSEMRPVPYVIGSKRKYGFEYKSAGRFIALFKRLYPPMNTQETLSKMRSFFYDVLSVQEKWIAPNVSLSFIVEHYNKIPYYLNKERVKTYEEQRQDFKDEYDGEGEKSIDIADEYYDKLTGSGK